MPANRKNSMTNELHSTVVNAFVARYTELAESAIAMAATLSEEQFWQRPFPFGNSFGHLVLHLTGNLNYYIGAQIANTGYVRDRPREFNEPNPPAKEEALRLLHDAVAMVIKTIGNQSPEAWSAEYSAVGTNCSNRLDMVVQCAAHMQHHIGQ